MKRIIEEYRKIWRLELKVKEKTKDTTKLEKKIWNVILNGKVKNF